MWPQAPIVLATAPLPAVAPNICRNRRRVSARGSAFGVLEGFLCKLMTPDPPCAYRHSNPHVLNGWIRRATPCNLNCCIASNVPTRSVLSSDGNVNKPGQVSFWGPLVSRRPAQPLDPGSARPSRSDRHCRHRTWSHRLFEPRVGAGNRRRSVISHWRSILGLNATRSAQRNVPVRSRICAVNDTESGYLPGNPEVVRPFLGPCPGIDFDHTVSVLLHRRDLIDPQRRRAVPVRAVDVGVLR